ncbi:MAG: hypothetical protein COA79_06910 [Planctomycetota bacterium]|nr:MAG: hypothetical protein COA79_06910 [Planctomycetota bacterium]
MKNIIDQISKTPELTDHLDILRNIPNSSLPIKYLIQLYETNLNLSASLNLISEVARCNHNELPQELQILFLCQWAELSLKLNRWEEVKILSHQVNELLTDNCLSEFQSMAHLLQIKIYSAEKQSEHRDKLFEKSFKSLNKKSPYYAELMTAFIYYYAIDGRLYVIPKKVSFLENHPVQKYRDTIKICHLFDDTIKGNISSAIKFIDEIEGLLSKKIFFKYLESYKRCRYLIDLMLLQQQKMPTGYLNNNLEIDKKNDPQRNHLWVQSTLYLMENKKEEALTMAKNYFDTLDVNQRFKGDEFCLIRTELANGNANAALRLLSHRLTKGLYDNLDLYFYGRAELILNNHQKAKDYFTNFIQSYQKLNSDGRFTFELELSLELTRKESYFLGQLNYEKSESVDIQNKFSNTPRDNETVSSINKIITINPVMIQLKKNVLKYAQANSSVLILGETGTGKELFARAIHFCGNRKNNPFVSINCAAISATLIESELFGHVKGAFSGAYKNKIGLFESAGDGSIFLDEIGELSPELQASLLRVLESGEIRPVGGAKNKKVNCRIIAATNADLEMMVHKKQFRRDLIYRLDQLEIKIPPLRERKEDIALLVRTFFNDGRNISEPVYLSDQFENAISKKSWPGNIRQLKNFVEKHRILNSEKDAYHLEDLNEKDGLSDNQDIEESKEFQIEETINLTNKNQIQSNNELNEESIKEYLAQSSSKENIKEKIRELFRKYKDLKGIQVAHILSLPAHRISRYMIELCNEKFIKRVNNTNSPRTQYFKLIE